MQQCGKMWKVYLYMLVKTSGSDVITGSQILNLEIWRPHIFDSMDGYLGTQIPC